MDLPSYFRFTKKKRLAGTICAYTCQQTRSRNPILYTNLTVCTAPSRTEPYLGIDDEYFALRDANFQVTDFVSVTVPKTCIKWVAVLGKQVPNVLNTQQKSLRQVFSTYSSLLTLPSPSITLLSSKLLNNLWTLKTEKGRIPEGMQFWIHEELVG